MSNGDVIQHNSESNPCVVVDEYKLGGSRCTCFTLLIPRLEGTSNPLADHAAYCLLGGNDSGQVFSLDVKQQGKKNMLAQV